MIHSDRAVIIAINLIEQLILVLRITDVQILILVVYCEWFMQINWWNFQPHWASNFKV